MKIHLKCPKNPEHHKEFVAYVTVVTKWRLNSAADYIRNEGTEHSERDDPVCATCGATAIETRTAE